jgi:hypothetical protein
MDVGNHEHKYKNIFDIYFVDGNVDINQVLQQPNEQLKVFIKSNIVPYVSDYPPSLRKELESLKLIKRQSYKEIMAGFKKPSRTDSEQRLYELGKLKEMNPKILAPKFETI